MTLNKIKKEVRRLIANNNALEAINLLLSFLDDDNESRNDIILNSAILTKELKNVRSGLQSKETPIQVQKVNKNILDILDSIKIRKRKYKVFYICIVLFVFLLCSAFFIKNLYFKKQRAGQVDFMIIEKKEILDLSALRLFPHARSQYRISPAIRTYHYLVEKLNNNTKYIIFDFYTTGLQPDIVCFSHPFIVRKEKFESPNKTLDYSRYSAYVDVSAINPHDTINVSLQAIYWNSYDGPLEETTGTLVLHQTNLIDFTIRFPNSKPLKSYTLIDMPLDDGREEEASFYSRNKVEVSTDSLVLNWKIYNPDIMHSNRIRWNW